MLALRIHLITTFNMCLFVHDRTVLTIPAIHLNSHIQYFAMSYVYKSVGQSDNYEEREILKTITHNGQHCSFLIMCNFADDHYIIVV